MLNIEIDSKINEIYSKTIVKQRFKNNFLPSLELRAYFFKKKNLIFSSFSAKIGDSITVKSKIIKKEKAEEKYVDSLSSGNVAIFVSEDPSNENLIVINIGNIPPLKDLIFISEFIQYTESSENYEFEFFRNLPILVTFLGGSSFFPELSSLKGQIDIKTKNKIIKIEKAILSEKINILEEKYLDEINKNNYLVKYEYNNINKKFSRSPDFDDLKSIDELDYIPSSKIYFELEKNEPLILIQNYLLYKDEKCYNIQYKFIEKKLEEKISKNLNLNPALFIFLIDQSGSMDGNPIKVAKKSLLLFIQSLPAGSYYQIIGFGSDFKKYDQIPKEYNEYNIKNSIQLIYGLEADLGGTDIYSPLQDIYNSDKIYDKIELPKNIFLLTDGEINNKGDTLAIIEKNSNKYSIYSIGIGDYFDKDLIKNAGIIGKGNYNFCKDIETLNKIIATEINNATSPFISNFEINTHFLQDNSYNINYKNTIIKKNKVLNFGYVLKQNENNLNPINFDIKYKENNNRKTEEKKENYKIIPYEIPKGEELFKLILNNYILENVNLSEEEKLGLSLKYQILNKETSLFAEIELSDKITEEMKIKIIGNKENNILIKKRKRRYYGPAPCGCTCSPVGSAPTYYRSNKKSSGFSFEFPNIFKSVGNSIKNFFSFKKNESETNQSMDNNQKDINNQKHINIQKDNKININEKEELMKIINTQNFVNGYWDINNETKNIKKKYEREFNLLKGLKDKNIDDIIAMTIIMVFFINKEHNELLIELVMIIKKAKFYIQDRTKSTYENIINEIGLN